MFVPILPLPKAGPQNRGSSICSLRIAQGKSGQLLYMKFAIVKTGGKQYKVAEGDILSVEKLDSVKDSEVSFDEVLLVVDGEDVKVGQPKVGGAKVIAKVLEEGKGDKKMVFRYKSKTRQYKKKGHRQPFTKIQITKITA